MQHITQYGPGDYHIVPMAGVIDPRYDAESSASREDRIQVIASHYWDRNVGDPVRADRLHEAISEVLGCMDEAEIGELGQMASNGPDFLGAWLIAKATDWLQAECEELARADVDREDSQIMAEAVVARMGY